MSKSRCACKKNIVCAFHAMSPEMQKSHEDTLKQLKALHRATLRILAKVRINATTQ